MIKIMKKSTYEDMVENIASLECACFQNKDLIKDKCKYIDKLLEEIKNNKLLLSDTKNTEYGLINEIVNLKKEIKTLKQKNTRLKNKGVK